MPQGPIPTQVSAVNPNGGTVPAQADGLGNLKTSGVGGDASSLYINASKLVSTKACAVVRVNVLVAGTAGAIYDTNSTAGNITANEIAVIPATQGPVALEFPCLTGLLVVPGNGQIVSVSYQAK